MRRPQFFKVDNAVINCYKAAFKQCLKIRLTEKDVGDPNPGFEFHAQLSAAVKRRNKNITF